MIKILKQWLMDCLGLIIDEETFPENAKDGILVGKVLYSYGIITFDQLGQLEQSIVSTIALDNFEKHVVGWLEVLNIKLERNELMDIAYGKGMAIINLFYRMYLELQDKNKLYFIAQQRKFEKLHPENDKFKVEPVVESKMVDFMIEPHPLCKPLTENTDIIKWHKERFIALTQQCNEARNEYLKYMKSKYMQNPESFLCGCKVVCICPKDKLIQEKIDYPEPASEIFTYEELVDLKKKANNVMPYNANTLEARNLVQRLKTRHIKIAERNLLKTQLHNELLTKLWNEMLVKLESKIKDELSEKLLNQSYYEKQMITKMFQVKHQQDVMTENIQFINDEISKQKESEIMNELFRQDQDTTECRCDYYYQREKTLELHRRIFSEKMRLKEERTKKMCRKTVEDLVDFAYKIANYKEEFGVEPDRRKLENLTTLFTSGKTLIKKVFPTEDILQDLSELPEDWEPLYIEEIERQDAMDDGDFEKYNNFQWPWDIAQLSIFKEVSEKMQNGLNIIGFIVYKLLSDKSPLDSKFKPNFNFKYRVCVNGLVNLSIRKKLQSLLNHRNIQVLEIDDVVNYCVDEYKKEAIPTFTDDVQSVDEIKVKSKKLNRKLQKGKKTPPTPVKEDVKDKSESVQKQYENKKHQTPPAFPDDEIKLTHAAKLGENVINLTSTGECLPDYLVCAMVVEYLKTIPNKDGWVLLNYPTTYSQAMSLEENLSGETFILGTDLGYIRSIVELTDIDCKKTEDFEDKDRERRKKSKLFSNPVKEKPPSYFETSLTAYIKTKVSDTEENPAECSLPPVINFLADDSDPLEKFYAEQGCIYSLFYETFGNDTLKYLARLIIGDYSLPQKDSQTLFGQAVLFLDRVEESDEKKAKSFTTKTKQDKKKKPLVIKKEKKSTTEKADVEKKEPVKKDKKKKKTQKQPVELEEKEVQVPPLEDVYDVTIEEEGEEIISTPGDENWSYLEIPINDEVIEILRKLCENLELIYVEDFKQIFFIRRVILNSVIPYVSYAKNQLVQFMNRPDNRQEIIHEFQMTFNAMPAYLRSDEEVKAELHCRVSELKTALWNKSDNSMVETLDEYERLLKQNWLKKQINELMNVFFTAFQLESNRFVDTLQLLTDYYVIGITTFPCNEEPFQKLQVRDMHLDNTGIDELNETQHLREPQHFYIGQFHNKINDKHRKVAEFVEKTKQNALKIVDNTQSQTQTGKKEKEKGSPTRRKKEKIKQPEVHNFVKENLENITAEWKAAISGEAERVILRLRLIKKNSKERFEFIRAELKKTMDEIYKSIKTRYKNQIDSITRLCDLLVAAIEEECPVQNELIIEGESVHVDPNVVVFDDPPPPPDPPVDELKTEDMFTIEQLNRLHKIFTDLAPSGLIPERTFAFLLQDMLVQEAEDGSEPLAPLLWTELYPKELDIFTKQLFSNSESIHWKDFLVFNFLIPVPSAEELLELRREFRTIDQKLTETISLDIFNDTTFWFEKHFDTKKAAQMKRLELMKDLIFKMYKTSETEVNYTAMLIDFCRDINPVEGFAKALALVTGRLVCWDHNSGVRFVNNVSKKNLEHDLAKMQRIIDMEENSKMADKIMDEIVDQAVAQCTSVTITEISSGHPVSLASVDQCNEGCICDLECFCEHPVEKFSNVSIDFEENPNPPLVYFLNFDHILAVEAAVLAWQNLVQNVDGKSFREVALDIFEECRNVNFNNAVLTHEFLNSAKFRKLLNKTTKFSIVNPVNIVKRILEDRLKQV